VENNTIVCPCHGCRFSTVDGSVQTGSATKPLEKATITLDGGQLRLLE
jgi:Rieske Fe-S protein